MSEPMRKPTRLCSWGTSRAVRIPREVCERVGVNLGSALDMIVGHDERGSFIMLRPETEHRVVCDVPYVSMDEAFSAYDGDYLPGECDWGEDVGKEVVS